MQSLQASNRNVTSRRRILGALAGRFQFGRIAHESLGQMGEAGVQLGNDVVRLPPACLRRGEFLPGSADLGLESVFGNDDLVRCGQRMFGGPAERAGLARLEPGACLLEAGH